MTTTENIGLPLYEQGDSPAWSGDWNSAMQKIDENIGGGGGSGSSISVDNYEGVLDYGNWDEHNYYTFLRHPLDGKPLGVTINMAHTFIFDADTLSQMTPPIIYEENNTQGGVITYSLLKEGDDWYLDVYGEAPSPSRSDTFQVFIMLS